MLYLLGFFRRVAICVGACGSLLTLLALLAIGYAAQSTRTPNPSSRTEPVSSAVVQLLAVSAGARGQSQECSATGFLVNEDGYILTNAHVVESSQDCLAKNSAAKIVAKIAQVDATPSGSSLSEPNQNIAAHAQSTTATVISCDVVGLDEVHDLALLKTERPVRSSDGAGGRAAANSYVELSAGKVMVGAPVIVSGHPAFAWVARTQSGHLIGRKTLPLFERSAEWSEVLVLDIPLQRGNSGSPVYREAQGSVVGPGGVVGVVERRDSSNTAQTLAVPIHYAIDMLNRLGVKWHAAPSRGALRAPAISE